MSGASIEQFRTGSAQGATPRLLSHSVQQTQHFGALLGAFLLEGDVVLLQGDLGAGKTALTQGIGTGMGVQGVINSPTFTILKEYTGRLPLYHFDLYRIDDPEEVYILGFEDYLSGDGVCIVEWAERGEFADDGEEPWPASYLRVRLSADIKGNRETRLIDVEGVGPRGAALQSAWLHAIAQES